MLAQTWPPAQPVRSATPSTIDGGLRPPIADGPTINPEFDFDAQPTFTALPATNQNAENAVQSGEIRNIDANPKDLAERVAELEKALADLLAMRFDVNW